MQGFIQIIKHNFRVYIYIGLFMQALLGMLYFWVNFINFHEYEILSAMSIEEYHPIFSVIYIVQLVFGIYSVFKCSSLCLNRKDALWAGIFINTNPYIMQIHLSLLLYSLCFSATALLIYSLIKYNKNKVQKTLFIVLLVVLPIGSCYYTMSSGGTKNLKSTVGEAVVSRFTWPYLDGGYTKSLPSEVNSIFTTKELKEISTYQYLIDGLWQEKLEKNFTKNEVFKINIKTMVSGMKNNTYGNIKNIGVDIIAYAFPYTMMHKYNSGEVESKNSYNLMEFRDENLMIATVYLKFYRYFITISLLLSLTYIMILCINKIIKKQVILGIKEIVGFMIYLLYIGFIYSMQGGFLFDYKQATLSFIVLYIPLFCVIHDKILKGRE